MIFRLSRERRGPDRWLRLKVALFILAAAAAAFGMAREIDWLVFVAIALLAIGVAIRWLPRAGDGQGDRD